MPRSALIVEVPEVEPAVRDWRMSFDSARLGIPAHITLLFPFVPTEDLDPELVGDLHALFAGHEAFSFSLTEVADFPDETIWLAPEPAVPFRELTESIVARYPDYLPYEGIHDEIVPHLTVTSGDLSLQERVEADLRRHLPIEAEARQITLLVEDEAGRWSPGGRFPLGATTAGTRPAG